MGRKRNAYKILIGRERPLWRFEHKQERSIKLGIGEILYEYSKASCSDGGDGDDDSDDKPSCLSLGQVSK
jgi:hypothetical protein